MFLVERALCSGKTLAFQANDAGSIPAARSKILFLRKAVLLALFVLQRVDISIPTSEGTDGGRSTAKRG